MEQPPVSGVVFWSRVWPKLEAAGWESGLARDLEVGCRIYKPGRKSNSKAARPGEDFFLYNDYDSGLIDHVLENGLVSAEELWPPTAESQEQAQAEDEAGGGGGPSEDVWLNNLMERVLAEAAAQTKPLKKRGRPAATPKKTATPKKRKRKAATPKQEKAESAGDSAQTRQMTRGKKPRPVKEEKARQAPAQHAAISGQTSKDAPGVVVPSGQSERDMELTRCVESGTQLLRDVELNMLQFVALVIRHRRVLCDVESRTEPPLGPTGAAAEILADIQASQDDLTHEVDQLIEYLLAPAVLGSDEAQSLIAPRFQPASHSKLEFLREANVHLMQFVAALRRRRRPFSTGGSDRSLRDVDHLLEEWNARVQSIADLQNDLAIEANKLASFELLSAGLSQNGPTNLRHRCISFPLLILRCFALTINDYVKR